MASALPSLDFFGDDDAAAATPAAASAPAPATAPAPQEPAAAAQQWTDDDVRAFRKRLRLRVESDDAVPRPWAQWADGALDPRLEKALEDGGWAEPTPIQAQAAPALRARLDVLATAPSGRTPSRRPRVLALRRGAPSSQK